MVGVVGNVSNEGRGKDTRPETYLLDALAPVRQMKFIVRSDRPLSSLLPELRHATETIAPHLPVFAVNTMAQLADDSTSLERFASVVVTFFALSALALACLGIYSSSKCGVPLEVLRTSAFKGLVPTQQTHLGIAGCAYRMVNRTCGRIQAAAESFIWG